MKKLLLLITVLVGLGIYAYGYCWDCPPKKCMFDTECGVGCFCYKGEYELYGVCVTK